MGKKSYGKEELWESLERKFSSVLVRSEHLASIRGLFDRFQYRC